MLKKTNNLAISSLPAVSRELQVEKHLSEHKRTVPEVLISEGPISGMEREKAHSYLLLPYLPCMGVSRSIDQRFEAASLRQNLFKTLEREKRRSLSKAQVDILTPVYL